MAAWIFFTVSWKKECLYHSLSVLYARTHLLLTELKSYPAPTMNRTTEMILKIGGMATSSQRVPSFELELKLLLVLSHR